MFVAVVRGKQPVKGLLGRLRKNRFTAEERSVGGAAYYLIETATQWIPWAQIQQIAGRGVQFLVEKGVEAPEDIPLFQGDQLVQALLQREFLKALRRTRPAQLTVVDYDGSQMEQMQTYFRYAAQIRVITGKTEAYTAASFALLQETGAALLISGDLQAARGSEMVYAPKGLRGRLILPAETMLFTRRPGESGGSLVYYPRSAVCSSALEQMVPEGIAPIQFFSALYELSGFRQTEQIKLDIGLYI